jgi:hypothetical protein
MVATVKYHVTSRIWLSLERYYNAGLTPEQAREVIERIADPGSNTSNLRCKSSGFNGNWIVETSCRDEESIETIFYHIELSLSTELARQKKQHDPHSHSQNHSNRKRVEHHRPRSA